MSRTKHHRGQASNRRLKDLWSRRPNSMAVVSSKSRRITKRIERANDRLMEHEAMRGGDPRSRYGGE